MGASACTCSLSRIEVTWENLCDVSLPMTKNLAGHRSVIGIHFISDWGFKEQVSSAFFVPQINIDQVFKCTATAIFHSRMCADMTFVCGLN